MKNNLIKMRQDNNDGLLELINQLPTDIVMGEVGCYAGESTRLFLKSGKVKKMYAIDPWENGYDERDPASKSDMVLVENTFDVNVKGYDVVKMKMSITEAIKDLPLLDVIYIDGDHQYDAVLNDITLAIDVVKKNGIIAGHDYRKENPIVMAVKLIFGKPDMVFSDSSWLCRNNINIYNMNNRTIIINKLFETYNFKTYLEIGVRVPAENFDKINAELKHSVDPEPLGACTYITTSDKFFENHVGNQKYDVIFVDGMHTAEQVYLDVLNSIKHLNNGGFIVMHDCNPPTEFHVRTYDEYLKTRGEWNGTVFKGFIQLKQELKDWNCFVINEDWGCGIITQKEFKRNFPALETLKNNISWNYFDDNREELLDLMSFEEYEILL